MDPATLAIIMSILEGVVKYGPGAAETLLKLMGIWQEQGYVPSVEQLQQVASELDNLDIDKYIG